MRAGVLAAARCQAFDSLAGAALPSHVYVRASIQEGSASMDITEVRVFPVSEERLKAYVTITLDNCAQSVPFTLNNLRATQKWYIRLEC